MENYAVPLWRPFERVPNAEAMRLRRRCASHR